MIILSKEQILKIHTSLIQATGGSDGIRDEGMLDLALNNPFQSFGGKELYPSVQAKAARLCFGLVKNHAMLDGNKRLGTHVMLVFLALNGYELSYSQKELSDIILALASGYIGEKEILQWIIEHQK
ncbi:MAG: type II toxin-antitoxin system death-on-curing family toxin [Lachnospiraceae bacterium]|nr:type II toxin-antitoxin system death-on-curing family toxin [Lachnospiraceae bacterium]MBD5498771.1 type II toxin-antitoxin system death-on-curing family toxin [Lachnospiraceae bacterium]MBD5511260.1 type II toxin-antitoxin system death-on-curing family toxin [Lachnospiraceae bacterium]